MPGHEGRLQGDSIVVAVTRDGSLYMGNSNIKKEEITGPIKDQIATQAWDKYCYVNSVRAPSTRRRAVVTKSVPRRRPTRVAAERFRRRKYT